jgi:hypothetical protein
MNRPTLCFIGIGQVGAALAGRLVRLGYPVTIAARDAGSASVRAALARHPGLRTANPTEAVAAAQVVFLATPYASNASALAGLDLRGKILIDCTNPVGPGLTHGLQSRTSGSAEVQRLAPGASVVKAFSIYGFENFEDNAFPSHAIKPAMLFCGDDDAAKAEVGKMIAALGWEPCDVGGLEQALHLEHMTLLWIRLVRANGGSPHQVWAALRR